MDPPVPAGVPLSSPQANDTSPAAMIGAKRAVETVRFTVLLRVVERRRANRKVTRSSSACTSESVKSNSKAPEAARQNEKLQQRRSFSATLRVSLRLIEQTGDRVAARGSAAELLRYC